MSFWSNFSIWYFYSFLILGSTTHDVVTKYHSTGFLWFHCLPLQNINHLIYSIFCIKLAFNKTKSDEARFLKKKCRQVSLCYLHWNWITNPNKHFMTGSSMFISNWWERFCESPSLPTISSPSRTHSNFLLTNSSTFIWLWGGSVVRSGHC